MKKKLLSLLAVPVIFAGTLVHGNAENLPFPQTAGENFVPAQNGLFGPSREEIKKEAMGLVEDIFKRDLDARVTCLDLRNFRKAGDDFYKASAEFRYGLDRGLVDITIEIRETITKWNIEVWVDFSTIRDL